MPATAILVYIGPKIESNYLVPCLEAVAGKPLLRHLFERLQRAFPHREYEFHVLFHDDVIPQRLEEALTDTPVKRFHSHSLYRLAVFADFLAAHPHLKELLIFDENALFPDLETTRFMLQTHRGQKADATLGQDLPPGFLPAIFDAKAILRLASLGLPEEVSGDIAGAMKKCQELAGEDRDMQFSLTNFRPALFPRSAILENLPPRILIDNGLALQAAEAVMKILDEKAGVDATAAYQFKTEILALESKPRFTFSLPSSKGDRVTVLYTTMFSGFSGAEESFCQMIIHLDRKRFYPLALLPSRSTLSEKLTAAGVHVEFYEGDIALITPRLMSYLDAFLEAFQVQLVHINVDAGAPVVLAARAHQIPIVFHARTLPGMAAPELWKFATKIIAISKTVAKNIARSNLDPQRIVQLYNGVDLEAFQAKRYDRLALRQEAGISADAQVIALVARISPQKNQLLLLQALPDILLRCPKALVLLVGENYEATPSYQRELSEAIDQLKLGNHLRFWGFEKDIAKIYALSDVLTLCTPFEPLGRCIIEALSMGTPVVVPDRAGPAELIEDGQDGLLYNPSDPSALAAGLVKVLKDPLVKGRLVEKGLVKSTTFDIKIHVAQISPLYDELLGRYVVNQRPQGAPSLP